MSERVRAALRSIPGWQDASLHDLPDGVTNRAFLVRAGKRRAVLKSDESIRVAPFATRADEARIQRLAAEAGLASEVYYADETTLLVEFAEGEVWIPEDLGDDARLMLLASGLRRLHSLPLSGRTFDAVAAARVYRAALHGREAAIAREHVEIIKSSGRPGNLCLCHNDLVAANILSVPELRFIDWEYACDNDPLFDLAIVIEHHGLDEGQADTLLDAYFDGDGLRWRAAMDRQRRLYRSLLWLWSAARRACRPATGSGVA